MIKNTLTLALLFVASLATGSLSAADKIKVLILDGPQRSHQYKKTTPVLKQTLEQIPQFEVDHSRSTKEGCEDGSYKPSFITTTSYLLNSGL